MSAKRKLVFKDDQPKLKLTFGVHPGAPKKAPEPPKKPKLTFTTNVVEKPKVSSPRWTTYRPGRKFTALVQCHWIHASDKPYEVKTFGSGWATDKMDALVWLARFYRIGWNVKPHVGMHTLLALYDDTEGRVPVTVTNDEIHQARKQVFLPEDSPVDTKSAIGHLPVKKPKPKLRF